MGGAPRLPRRRSLVLYERAKDTREPRGYDRAMTPPTEKGLRAARLADALSRAVRSGEVHEVDALRVLRHELRRRNTNSSLTIPRRSQGAQASIDKYAPALPPKNGSPDALHVDHVYSFTSDVLQTVDGVEDWVAELERLRTVVCVTAAENYALQRIEQRGVTGPEKYSIAGVTFTTPIAW